jgi:serpin B
MSQSGEAECYAGDAFKAVRLPYRGGEFAFIAMLPGEGRSVGELLTKGAWSAMSAGFVKQDANIVLPKFAFGAEHDLKPAIERLGLPSLFNESCNLRLMSSELESGSRFSRMVHKALVRVDEEGTTAAAVTMSAIEGGEKGEGAFEFVADRPFAFAIVDVKTGVICFLGAVSEP